MPDMQLRDIVNRWVTDKLLQVDTTHSVAHYFISESHRQMLDFTKNTGIHFFVSVACLAQLLSSNSKKPFEEVVAEYQLLKQLFRYEFNFSTRRAIDKHLHTLTDYIAGKPLSAFAAVMDNYLDAYRILFQFMQQPQRPQDAPERQWIKLLIQYGTQLKKSDGRPHVEAVSKSIFQNGLRLLQHMGVLDQTASGNLRWKGINPLYNQLQSLLSSLTT